MPTGIAKVSIDTEGCLASWLNSLTSTLVGNGQPLDRGVFFEVQRSPGKSRYAVLSRIDGADAWNEACADLARMSCSIFSTTKKSAALAAAAYANALRSLTVVQPVVPEYGALIRMADNLSGPRWIPNLDKALPQYVVDADVYFLPTT
jgi:hypothetical protein